VDLYNSKRDLLTDLLEFWSSENEELVPLREYVKKMPENQKFIYYACGENIRMASGLPQTEPVRAKGYEILYLTEDVDEFVIRMLGSYQEKPFCNVSSDDLGIDEEENREETEKQQEAAKPLLDFIKECLGDRVSDVRLSHKLVSHPVCLTTEGEITLEMEKYFQSIPGAETSGIRAQRVLELNGQHAAFEALLKAYKADPERAKKMSEILLDQAMLIAGLPLEDPANYTELVCSLF